MSRKNNTLEFETKDMILFWKNPSIYSQWTPSDFEVRGVCYNCAEQFMMAEKARIFGDECTREAILQSTCPRQQKQLGRIVNNFDPTIWDEVGFSVVVEGNIAKFGQNPELLEKLLQTGNKILAEASPLDKIWGIGLAPDNYKAQNQANWKGRNLLGKALMVVREHFLTSLKCTEEITRAL